MVVVAEAVNKTWPAERYLRLGPMVATAILLLNDHVLKDRWGNELTGKLSDLAGVFLLPLVLIAAYEIALFIAKKPWPATSQRLLMCIAVTGAGFSLVKLSPTVADWYGLVLGELRWPFEALLSIIVRSPLANRRSVQVTADWTDLAALPMLWVSWRLGTRYIES